MKNNKPSFKNRKRVLFIFAVFVLFFGALTFRVAWHQIIMGPEYTQKASRQQTADNVISALRGDVLDRNGGQLAISATAHTIWARPSTVKDNGKTDADKAANVQVIADTLVEILGLDPKETMETITANKSLVKVTKNVESEKADALRSKLNELGLVGIDIIEDSKRFYPLGAFASQIVGITTDDNVGLTGLEKYYNQYLSGVNGRWITSKDNKQNSLIYGEDKYYSAKDGYTIVTTIDANIQRIVEEKIADYQKKFDADRVFSIVMDPKTGEVIAMAQTDEFDLNNPRTCLPGDEKKYEKLTDAEKVEYWSNMWRNFCVCDVYEPGSTFKPITAALALDYGVTDMKEKFYCSGSIKVADWTIHCWDYPRSHGYETVADAVMNSCNPVMVQLIQRIGKTNYYNGLRTFCITEKTAIDFPGEGTNLIYGESAAGPVELATMSFGQGIAVTPVSLVSAFSSLANGGKLMQPHFVKQILDADGKVVEDIQPVVRNITVSEETASDMMDILEKVVSEGGGGKAAITGYRIGGKTGTSYKPKNGVYDPNIVYTSFMGLAPMEDPQYVCLVVFDTPRVKKTASATACACEKEIMQEILLYKNIVPNYTSEELAKINKAKRAVPDLVGKNLEDAIGILAGKGLECEISGDPGMQYEEIFVTDQFPKAGTELDKGSVVTIYYQ